MNYEDLECFVLTYNRAEYLKIQLDSLCNSNAKGFKIRILDNASTDNTKEIVQEIKKKYPDREIEHIVHPENIGNPNNFKKSQELAERKYCAVFHDDDVVHPDYIKFAMEHLHSNPHAVYASCFVEDLYHCTKDNWKLYGKDYYLINGNDFAWLMMQGDRPSFAASIYKTDVYKSCTYKNDSCGKIHDVAFMFECGSKGDTILLGGKFLRYRLSNNQDSHNYKTGPFPDEIANALKIVSTTIINHKFIAKFRLYEFAKLLFSLEKTFEYVNCSFSNFEELLIKNGCFTQREFFFIKLFHKIIHKFIKKKVKKYFKKIRHN